MKHVRPYEFDADAFLATVTMDAGNASRLSVEEIDNLIGEYREELEELNNLGSDEDLTDDDIERVEELAAEIKKLTNQRKIAQALEASNATRRSRGRRTTEQPGERRRGGDTVPAQPRNADEDRRHGFDNFGSFALDVINAAKGEGKSLERLENVATTYGSESIGADGGYLVPPEFSDAIWQKVRGEGSLMSRCLQMQTSRNSLTIPKVEDTPWNNSSGVRVFWENEGGQMTESKPAFETETARLKKLTALVNVTEELLDDAVGLESYLQAWAPVKIESRVNTAIVNGTGVGQPLGIINSPSLITVTKETSQDAASVLFPNINKMWNRLYAPLRANAVWLINQEVEPQLDGMQFIPANEHGSVTAGVTQPVYLPSGTVAGRPFATLKGAPVLPMQACQALGTLGDIILVDLMQYMILTKGGGIQYNSSIHLHFDQAMQTLRFILRVMGQGLWGSTITPENGSNSYSWAVVMEDRT